MKVRTRNLFDVGAVMAALAVSSAAHATIVISSDATSNVSCASGVCTPTAANAVLNVGDLTAMLASGNVTVNTGTGSLAQQVEDIIVSAPFNWASANSLTLDAYRSVTVSAPIAVSGSAPVALLTDDGGSGGFLSFGAGGNLTFLGTANHVSINGKAYTLENSISTLAAAIKKNAFGRYALSESYDAGRDKTYKQSPIRTKFNGRFEGLGNVISNLTIITKVDKAIVGLFSELGDGGAISDLVVGNINVTAKGTDNLAGGIVGRNYFGTLEGDSVQGTIIGGTSADDQNNFTFAGGLVAYSNGTITRSTSAANVTAGVGASIGGLTGWSDGTISLSSASGQITGKAYYAGGLAGVSQELGSSISQCFATGAVVPDKAINGYFGGLVGVADINGVISDSYSTGAVTGGKSQKNRSVGGLLGWDGLDGNGGGGVSNSYSTGAVSGGALAGGFVAFYASGGSSNDYWDTTTSGTSEGTGDGNQANITGETTAQLQSGLPTGFDPAIWAQNPSINNGFPYLIANPPL